MDNRSMEVPFVCGVVKDGVIVPNRPLADGTYVEVIVPNAPREIVDRVRWAGREQTSARNVEGVSVEFGPSVDDLLRHHQAESAFANVVRCIKEAFPDVISSQDGGP